MQPSALEGLKTGINDLVAWMLSGYRGSGRGTLV